MTAFAAPASQEGASVKPADLLGHLLIIKPVEYKTGIQTSLGEAEAIEVDLIDLDTNEEHTSVLFFNVKLRSALKSNIGKQVLARIGQGIASPGKSAPFILINAAETPADVEKANAYLAGEIVKGASEQPTTTLTVTPEIQALIDKLGAKPF
jgi:hypothetical protein